MTPMLHSWRKTSRSSLRDLYYEQYDQSCVPVAARYSTSHLSNRKRELLLLVVVAQSLVGAMCLVTVCCFELNLISILQNILKGMGLSPYTYIPPLNLFAFPNLQVPLCITAFDIQVTSTLNFPTFPHKPTPSPISKKCFYAHFALDDT